MFVATADTLNIPEALMDRMEIIHVSSYMEDEKINIATRYLVPKAIKTQRSQARRDQHHRDCLRDIVRYYMREAGVRGLEREISKICRKVVKALLLKTRGKKVIGQFPQS